MALGCRCLGARLNLRGRGPRMMWAARITLLSLHLLLPPCAAHQRKLEPLARSHVLLLAQHGRIDPDTVLPRLYPTIDGAQVPGVREYDGQWKIRILGLP